MSRSVPLPHSPSAQDWERLGEGTRRAAVTALALILLAACGGAQPAAPPSAAASAIGTWDSMLAAAKKEGKLTLSGPPSQVWRTALTSFEKDYPDIKIEYTGTTSRDFWPKIAQEQKAGQYLWDLRAGGPDPQVFEARDSGELVPIAPLLMLPEATDESQWFGASRGLPWADNAKQYMRNFSAQGSTQIMVNRDLVPAGALSSARQLIDPAWKGKMVLQDPRGGSGLGASTTILVSYGEDFLRKLFTEQALAITADNRQEAEWLVRGRYMVGIGNVTD
ncbi:MAG TPA: extracellular solute-binding protein, partial [Chloroflexota bacterium]|nr:extracellular solute-binding protein [Chloroflexota bacterium]